MIIVIRATPGLSYFFAAHYHNGVVHEIGHVRLIEMSERERERGESREPVFLTREIDAAYETLERNSSSFLPELPSLASAIRHRMRIRLPLTTIRSFEFIRRPVICII